MRKIIINLQNAVMNTNKEHIDIIKEIKFNLANQFNISKEKVIVYE